MKMQNRVATYARLAHVKGLVLVLAALMCAVVVGACKGAGNDGQDITSTSSTATTSTSNTTTTSTSNTTTSTTNPGTPGTAITWMAGHPELFNLGWADTQSGGTQGFNPGANESVTVTDADGNSAVCVVVTASGTIMESNGVSGAVGKVTEWESAMYVSHDQAGLQSTATQMLSCVAGGSCSTFVWRCETSGSLLPCQETTPLTAAQSAVHCAVVRADGGAVHYVHAPQHPALTPIYDGNGEQVAWAAAELTAEQVEGMTADTPTVE